MRRRLHEGFVEGQGIATGKFIALTCQVACFCCEDAWPVQQAGQTRVASTGCYLSIFKGGLVEVMVEALAWYEGGKSQQQNLKAAL